MDTRAIATYRDHQQAADVFSLPWEISLAGSGNRQVLSPSASRTPVASSLSATMADYATTTIAHAT